MFNGATVLKDFNIAVCLKKIVTTLLAKSARNLINNYSSRPELLFFACVALSREMNLHYDKCDGHR